MAQMFGGAAQDTKASTLPVSSSLASRMKMFEQSGSSNTLQARPKPPGAKPTVPRR